MYRGNKLLDGNMCTSQKFSRKTTDCEMITENSPNNIWRERKRKITKGEHIIQRTKHHRTNEGEEQQWLGHLQRMTEQ